MLEDPKQAMAPNEKRSGFRFPWGGERHEEDLPLPSATPATSIGNVLVEHRTRPAPMALPGHRKPVLDPDDVGPGPFDITADDDLETAEAEAVDEAEREEELQAAEALAEEEAVREALDWPSSDLAARAAHDLKVSTNGAGPSGATEAAGSPEHDAEAAGAAAEGDAVDEAVAAVVASEAEAASAAAATLAGATLAGAEAEPKPEPASDVPAVPAADAPARPAIVVEGSPPTPAAPVAVAVAREPRRDNPLIANLVRAMREATMVSRDETVAHVRAESATRLEEIRDRATTRSVQLRKRTEEDVASIREWAKTEIARIRAEADDRIVGRKARLAREVETHADDTERRLTEVTDTVAAFEAEMAGYFEGLLREEDPARLATLAERMPEPPAFGALPELEDDATATGPMGHGPGGPGSGDDTGTDTEADTGDDAAPRTRSGRRRGRAAAAASQDDLAPLDVSETELEDPDETVTISRDLAAILNDEETLAALSGLAAAEEASRTAANAAVRAEADAAEAAKSARHAESDAADAAGAARRAEAEAARRNGADTAVAVAPGPDDDDTGPFSGVPVESQTRVLVSGLASIAAISAFKVALGRLTGITSVNVTAAVDGEFVFSVTHAEYTDLRPLLPHLPGFTVTIRSDEGGILRVDAVEAAS